LVNGRTGTVAGSLAGSVPTLGSDDAASCAKDADSEIQGTSTSATASDLRLVKEPSGARIAPGACPARGNP
jgi:hypothetical protein